MQWYSYLVGYLIIRIEGPFPEKVINLALSRGIFLWDIIYIEQEKIILKIRLADFRALRHLVRASQGRMRIVARKGMPFTISQMKKRKVLVLGGFLFVISLYLLSSFVWSVEVSGHEELSKEEILRIARDCGLEPGISLYNLELEKLEEIIQQAHPKIAWVGISVLGTKVKINISEKVLVPETSEQRANLVAMEDGRIEEILVLVGMPLVKEGDLVQKGQVLIYGQVYPQMQIQEDGQIVPMGDPEYVKARGVIRGVVQRCVRASCLLQEEEIEFTGQQKNQISFVYQGKQLIIIGPREVDFSDFQIETSRRPMISWRDITTPVELIIKQYKEINRKIINYGYEGAYREAINRGERILAQQLVAGSKIIHKNVEIISSDNPPNDLVEVKLTWDCLEDIARSLEF